MKKSILFVLTIALSSLAYSQCDIDPALQDTAFGVFPDTATNFPPALINMAYLAQIDVKVPQDAGVVDPASAGIPVDSGAVTNVIGLPPGIIYECNSHTTSFCTFLGDSIGCAVLTGTPTQAGVFPLTIELTGFITFVGLPLPIPLSFDGYELVVEDPSGLNNPENFKVSLNQNVPNPFTGQTRIPFLVSNSGQVEITVSTLLGQEVFRTIYNADAGNNYLDFDGSSLDAGIYMYSITSGREKFTRKMFIEK